MVNKIKSDWGKFRRKPADIREVRIRNWEGHPLFKSRINVADKERLINSFKQEARMCGLEINIHGENKIEDIFKEVKEQIALKNKEDLDKIKKFVKGGEKNDKV